MRIVCPRCVAQYEVDESSIPQTGREVQCANCENIWFQDYIEMLPTSVDEDIDAIGDEDRSVFDDLDGKSDSNFYPNRGAGVDDDDPEASNDDEADEPTDLTSDDLDYDFDEDYDAPATNIPVAPVDPDVLDVLRSEAAFSSARDQLDVAAADALDGDGEAIKSALEETDQPTEAPDVDANVDADFCVDELAAFLDTHSEGDTSEPNDIAEDGSDYEPEYDDAFDAAALTAALDIGGQDRPELDDNFDDNSIAPAAAVAATAAAAVGMTRPRSKGNRARARTLAGFDAAPEKTEALSAELSSSIADAVQDAPKDIKLDIKAEDLEAAVDTDRKADPSRRPKVERKAMLPDVEELDASLRSDGDEPRRRDREMMGAHEDELANTGKGGFRRAFIWTLFIIILLIALYVFRPQIVAMLPASATILDPYAAAIDGVREMINGILG
ncbi:MAG: zinc-ribbon domain-containing protein [Amylibacter sp.]